MSEFFGTEAQQRLQWRSMAMFALLRDNPDYSCHGRAVAVSGHTPDTVDQQINLARLQGVGPSVRVPLADRAERVAKLTAKGLSIDEYVSWLSTERTIPAAQGRIDTRPLPDDLTIETVTAATPAPEMKKLDALTQRCEVLLPAGSFMRGLERPAVCLMAKDGSGRAVGAAAAVAQSHQGHGLDQVVWWGMLATDPDRRGQGIALTLGAHALLAMAAKGYHRFYTGIRQGNAPSEVLCAKLGFAAGEYRDIIAIDQVVFGQARVTK